MAFTCYTAVLLVLLAHGSAGLSVSSIPADVSQEELQVTSSKSGRSPGYIVTLRRAPVASYTGGTEGMASTASAPGGKLDVTTAAAVAYAQSVDAHSIAVAARAGVQQSILERYQFVMAGFATGELTAQQLQNLRKDPDVAFVTKNRIVKPHTLSTPRFLGLDTGRAEGTGGVWGRFGGARRAGDGVVIGVLDTGLWPEHAEFSDRRGFNPKASHVYPAAPTHYTGTCQGGKNFTANTCNRKVIGCNFFHKGWIQMSGRNPDPPFSCRDMDGHGTHTAATAAGNFGVPFMDGTVSGVAPHARIAVYKVLWGGTGTLIDILAGLDNATRHGVDIINFSIGDVTWQFPNEYSFAFLRAARAGILISASAGNSGPQPYTIGNAEPWIVTVAASTHGRLTKGAVLLDAPDAVGDPIQGSAWWWNLNLTGGASVSGKLVLGNEAARAGANVTQAQLCYADTLDPAKLEGKIVVCDRGENPRVSKSAEVKRSGGIGMILLNVQEDETVADTHSVPTVHLPKQHRDTVRTYAKNSGATAKLTQQPLAFNGLAPQMADFSSRGPCPVTKGLSLKPDITAPGVFVLAAYSPAVEAGLPYAVISGTSMSAPHVAGLAALLRQQYPTWSPMAIKSALMTTAYQTTRTGTPGQPFGTPLDYGAGHVDPQKMLFPGLVFDSSFADWAYYICGAVTPKTLLASLPDDIAEYCLECDKDPDKCDPANLNMPSISIPDMVAGSERIVYRTVKNVFNGAARFVAESAVDAQGQLVIVSVTPSSFMLGPGATQKVAITLKATAAAVGEQNNAGFVFGSISWTSNKGSVTRIPIAVSAVAVQAPPEVNPSAESVAANGTFSYDIILGFSGVLEVAHQGLEPAMVLNGTISTNETVGWDISFEEPYALARFSLFNADLMPQAPANASHDLDLVVFNKGELIGSSLSESSDESVTVLEPTGGRYTVQVTGFNVLSSQVQFYLHVWLLDKPQANMDADVAPASVEAGDTVKVQLRFSGVQFSEKPSGWPQERYLGKIDYRQAGGKVHGHTIVAVNE